jgi:hypothetical protein
MEAISGLNAVVVPGYSGGPVPDSNGVPSEALFLSAFTETKKTQAPDNVKIKIRSRHSITGFLASNPSAQFCNGERYADPEVKTSGNLVTN